MLEKQNEVRAKSTKCDACSSEAVAVCASTGQSLCAAHLRSVNEKVAHNDSALKSFAEDLSKQHKE